MLFAGFRFQFSSPIHTLHGVLSWTETRDTKREREEPILADEKRMVSEAGLEHQPDATNGTVTSGTCKSNSFQMLLFISNATKFKLKESSFSGSE